MAPSLLTSARATAGRALDVFADWWFGGRVWWYAVVVALYAAAAVAFTYPLAVVAADHIPYKPAGDQLFLLSLLEWQRTALLSQPGDFFTGNFYYGSGGALFASDLVLGLQVLYAPLAWLLDNPVLAFNLSHILAYVLNALAMYAAAHTLTGSRAAGLVAGFVYAFGALQLTYASHLQLLAAWWLPLALLFAIRFARSLDWRTFGAAVLMVGIQSATAVQLGVIAAFVVAGFAGVPALWHIVRHRDWRLAGRLVLVSALASAPFIPLARGYLDFSDAWRAERDITEVQFWSVQIRDYLSPGGRMRWYDALGERFPVPSAERRVFPGFMPPLLAALGLAAALIGPRVSGRRLRYAALTAAGLAAVGLVFSLGTHWKWHETVSDVELPYRWLFEHALIFRAIRVVARYSLLAHLGAAVLAAIGVAGLMHLGRRTPGAAVVLAAAISMLVLVEAFPRPLPAFRLPDHAELAEALAEAPPGPMLFVPVNYDEVTRMWISTRAGAGPLVNGYSGHIWQQVWYFRDISEDRSQPEAAALASGLQAYGIRNVVLRESLLGKLDRRAWAAFRRSPIVGGASEAGDYTIVTLDPPGRAPPTSWDSLDARVLATSVPPSAGVTSPLVLANRSDAAWVPPGSSRVRAVELEWIDAAGRTELRAAADVLPPPFLWSGQVHETPMRILTPPAEGEYRLIARIDGVAILDQVLTVADVAPQAFAGTGEGLTAELRLRTPITLSAHPGERLPIHVDALNTGTVGWVEDANVRLGWIWNAVEPDGSLREMPKYEGRLPLLGHIYGDVLPGTGYAFAGRMHAPDEPGVYEVHVSMVSELVAWFDLLPVVIDVEVTPWPREAE